MLAVTAVVAIAAMASLAAPARAADDPSVVGEWAPRVDTGVIGIHAVMLYTGKVLMYEGPAGMDSDKGSKAVLFDPTDNTFQRVDVPYAGLNIFCGGQSVMPDGRVLVTGGDASIPQGIGFGIANATIFDPATKSWSQAPDMHYKRWYPTNIQMPDGTTLVFSGQAEAGDQIAQVEQYDPIANTWTVLPDSASRKVGLYPRTFLLPSGRIISAGKGAQTKMFNPVQYRWSKFATMNYGDRKHGSAVFLPGLKDILVAGGRLHGTNTPPTNTAEILDTTAFPHTWNYTGSMNAAREDENLIILPDGKVAAIGGGNLGLHGHPVKTAELYDPATGVWTNMATQTAERTYHSTAVLLPDGRVLSAGSDSKQPEETSVEIWSPPYLFKGARPSIDSMSDHDLTYGSSFTINSDEASSISHVALIKPAATTHAFDMDQRYVDLNFVLSGTGHLSVNTPPDANTAVPGYYMVVIVDGNGIPSVMKFVHLG